MTTSLYNYVSFPSPVQPIADNIADLARVKQDTETLIFHAQTALTYANRGEQAIFLESSHIEGALRHLVTHKNELASMEPAIARLERLVKGLIWNTVAPLPQNPGSELLCERNREISKTWLSAGLQKEWFVAHPDCAAQIVKLHLHHTLRAWDGIARCDKDDKLEVLVEGVWKLAAPFFESLKETDKDTWESTGRPEEIWCCNAFGFQKRNPAEWKELPLTAILSAAELANARAVAAKLPSPKAEGETDCILEVLSGYKKTPNSFWMSGVEQIYSSPTHPFMRLIDENGQVYSHGFWPSKPFSGAQILSTCPGEFRSPDSYEGIPVKNRHITRIAISRAQFAELKQVIEKYQSEGKKFNVCHNCSAFVADLLYRLGFEVDSRIFIGDLLGYALPIFIQKILAPFKYILDKIRAIVARIMQTPIGQFFEKSLTKIHGTAKKVLKPAPAPHEIPFLGSNPDNFLRYPLPKRILEWQEKQPSTRIFPNGTPFRAQYA